MKKVLIIIIIIFLLSACLPTDDKVAGPTATAKSGWTRIHRNFFVSHDDTNNTTCWTGNGGDAGVFCIPDWQLTPPSP